jgi:succinate dehydrogenase / fumarate reductase membrane anchor subunit
MTQKTPLGQVLGLGSAHSGTEHFFLQRMTAVANVPLILFLIWFVLAHLGSTRADLVTSLHNPFVAILLSLALCNMLWHMRLGMQVVIEDYVHSPVYKLAAVLLNIFYTSTLGVAGVYAILKMSFGS